jgi:hypothetical protein
MTAEPGTVENGLRASGVCREILTTLLGLPSLSEL